LPPTAAHPGESRDPGRKLLKGNTKTTKTAKITKERFQMETGQVFVLLAFFVRFVSKQNLAAAPLPAVLPGSRRSPG
jgi:hypothetical protein